MILSSSCLTFSAKEELHHWEETLKGLTHVKFRRADRFSYAVLSGAISCLKQCEIKEFALYFGTSNGNVDSVKNSQDNISQNLLPMPFAFINTLSGTPLFFLLQYLNMQTTAIGTAHSYFAFENALALALVDLKQKRTKAALIGVCDVWYEPICKAREKLDHEACEFSAWLLMEYNEKDCVKFFTDFNKLHEFIGQFKQNSFYIAPDFPKDEREELAKTIQIQNPNTPKTITNYSAAVICAHDTKMPLFYIGYDSRGGYSFVNIN
jgi:hypothetical protein